MRRPLIVLVLSLTAACAGRSGVPAGPEPEQAGAAHPATGQATVETPPDLTEELDAEARLAADSAADAAALARLDEATPSDSDSDTGGPDALDAAGAFTLDVDTWSDHDRVQYYLNYFQGPARSRFQIWLDRLPRYEAMARAELAAQGMPGDLVYLALIESGYSNTAVSRARAVGMWQFMSATGRGYGLRIDGWIDERRDPFRATNAAARHLRDLQDRFGSLYLAAAAYNAGAGRVSRGLKRIGVPARGAESPDDEAEDLGPSDADFFRLYDTKLLRRETKDYVPKLIAAATIARAPEEYGFRPGEATDPFVYDSIIVPDMTGLDVVAKLAGATTADIRTLNPKYLRLATPPGERSVIRLPVGTGTSVATAYAELPKRERVTFVEHRVARGETLSHIARRYHVSLGALQDANPRVRARSLQVGQRLVIPTGSGTSAALAARSASADAAPTRVSYHRVRSGDSLWSISRRYGVSSAQLKRLNGLSGDKIRIGQRLRVR